MVLFVIVIHNYHGFTGFRMNTEQYSSHHPEQEIVLAEGNKIAVLGVDEVIFDKNAFTDEFMKDFNGKSLHVIYLFQSTICTN